MDATIGESGGNRPKLTDIARVAGVSTSTASRALSGKKGVALETIERIREVASQLHYPLRQPTLELTHTLGVLVANVASHFFATLVEAVEEVALQRGYNIILCNSAFQARRQSESLRLLTQRQVDGLIVVPIETEDGEVQRLVEDGIPVVQVDRYADNVRCDVVTSDNTRSAYKAVQFLLDQGHQRIGILVGPQNHSAHRDRLLGCIQAFDDVGRTLDSRLIKIGSGNKSSGYQLASELIESGLRPDVLFAGSIEITTGALLALRDRGVAIPDEMGILGFDEFEVASLLDPPLTTVEQPAYEMGAAAADLLIRRIEDHAGTYEPVKIQLESRLIVRRSTRPQPQVFNSFVPK